MSQVKILKESQFSDIPLYACDQICASEISAVPNNGKEISFPIHPTNPATPIVYIATQKDQLLTLRFHLTSFIFLSFYKSPTRNNVVIYHVCVDR